MATLDASGSSIALDIRQEQSLNTKVGNVTSAPVATATQFSETYTTGLRFDYVGSFGNYQLDDEDGVAVQVPTVALINSMNVSLNGAALYSLSGMAHNPTNYRGQSNEAKNLAMLSGDDQIIGSNLADFLAGGTGNDAIDGRGGIDTVKYSLAKSSYTVSKTGATFTVSGGNEGRDTLLNAERLQFADKKVALDVTDNALETMQFINVVAPALLANLSVRGTILSLFDQGHTLNSLAQLALEANLIPRNNSALVDAIYQNLFNALPDSSMKGTLLQYVEANGQARFVADVAALNLNIDIVGLQQNGVEYL